MNQLIILPEEVAENKQKIVKEKPVPKEQKVTEETPRIEEKEQGEIKCKEDKKDQKVKEKPQQHQKTTATIKRAASDISGVQSSCERNWEERLARRERREKSRGSDEARCS